MIFKVFLAVCLVGVALGHGRRRDCCTPGDRAIVQEQWGRLWGSADSGKIKIVLGHEVFSKLFERDPESRALFEAVGVEDTSSGQFQAHTVRVLNGIDTVVNLLQDEEAARLQISHLAEQHAVRQGVTATHFAILGDILLEGLGNLIPDFAEDSWESCFGRIANGITVGLPA